MYDEGGGVGISISRLFQSAETTKPECQIPGIPGSKSKPEKSPKFIIVL